MKEKIKEILLAVPIAGKTYPEYIEALADELIAEGVGLWEEGERETEREGAENGGNFK